MFRTLLYAIASALLLAGLPGLAMADHSELKHDVTQICKRAIKDRGYKDIDFDRKEFSESRSNYSLNGQFNKKSARYEFNCIVSTDMHVEDLVINSLGGGDYHSSGSGGAPAEAQVACAEEADKYWNLRQGTSVPTSSRANGSDMFEVEVSGGKHRGTCTVTKTGHVKFIMNR